MIAITNLKFFCCAVTSRMARFLLLATFQSSDHKRLMRTVMHAWTLQHVSVWLDDASQNEITYSHALEWATRLHLPLRVVAITDPPVMNKIKAWGETAALRGVALETHLTVERTNAAIEQFLRTNGLCVFSGAPESQIEKELLQRSSRIPTVCQLLCASTFTQINRVLVLCRDADLRADFLESAARLCHALETTPIILILAGSEYDAELKQEYAEGIFHSRRMQADVDFVIDRDPVHAVNRVVSWRRCSHIIMPRSSEVSDQLQRDLTTSVSVLTVPNAVSLDTPRRIRSNRGILPWSRLDVIEPFTASEHA